MDLNSVTIPDDPIWIALGMSERKFKLYKCLLAGWLGKTVTRRNHHRQHADHPNEFFANQFAFYHLRKMTDVDVRLEEKCDLRTSLESINILNIYFENILT